jgi:hypothetical protein
LLLINAKEITTATSIVRKPGDLVVTVRVGVRIRVTLRLAVNRQRVRLGDKPLRLTTSNFICQLNVCGYSPYVTSSLTRGYVCRLRLLLVLASVVIFGSESRGTRDHNLLSQIRDSPNLEGQVPVFFIPRLYPQTLGSFSSLPTNRRVTLEVCDPASTRDSCKR